MIDTTLIKNYTKSRSSLTHVQSCVNEALGTYFEGEKLKELIRPFGRNEEPEKAAWRQCGVAENYDNYVKEITDSYIEGVTKHSAPKRSVGSNKELNTYLDESYGRWLATELYPLSLILPETFVSVSLPAELKEAQTNYEATGKLPTPFIIFPQHVINYDCNLDGSLKWISIKDGDSIKIYDEKNVYFTTDSLVTKDFPHGYNYVPILRFVWRENRSMECCGHAMLHSVIKNTIGALTFVSMLLEAGFFHLTPKLVTDPETAKGIQKEGVGSNKIIKETPTPDASQKTRYLQMPDTEIEILRKIVYEDTPRRIYRMARLRDRSNVAIGTNQSGVSKAIDMIPESGVLKSIAEFWEWMDYCLVILMAESYPPTASTKEITVEYPRVFDVKSTAEIASEVTTFSAAMAESGLIQSPTGNALISEGIYRSMLAEIDEDELQVIEEEIQSRLEQQLNPNANTEASAVVLNGIQVTAAAAIVSKISAKEISRESGIALMQAMGMSNQQAELVAGEAMNTLPMMNGQSPVLNEN